ncbi:hypothetical protein NQZ68_005009 [Dissostichus eleginoides]|nr:hypothetical protein NQZ68_005009 [Dissostichus eleginoides]
MMICRHRLSDFSVAFAASAHRSNEGPGSDHHGYILSDVSVPAGSARAREDVLVITQWRIRREVTGLQLKPCRTA